MPVYFYNPKGNVNGDNGYIGSHNRHKIEQMAKRAGVADTQECEKWEFKGRLLGYEWVDR